MSESDEFGSNRRRKGTSPGNGGSVQDTATAAGPEDNFLAAFAAARGTVSPELDLNADVDEPVDTDRTGDAGRQRPGA